MSRNEIKGVCGPFMKNNESKGKVLKIYDYVVDP